MSTEWDKVLHAYNRGYRILENGEIKSFTGKLIKGYIANISNYNYVKASIRYKGKPTSFKVHKLQAYQKYGIEVLRKDMEIRHLDGDSTNNAYNNIVLGTHQQNMMDIPVRKRVEQAQKAASFQRKLTDDQVKALRKDRNKGLSYKDLMKKYGISKSTISYIVNNKTYAGVV